jgi:hypothetical protein
VADIKDPNLLGTVVNPIKNTIASDSNPPSFLELPSKELGSRRARIYRQRKDRTVDFLDERFGEFLKLLRCPGFD